jgi:hypothetical protein
MRDLGTTLAQTAGPNDVICLQTPHGGVEPQISYYARRSVLFYQSDNQILKHLNQYGLKRAVIVSVDNFLKIQNIRWLSTSSPT